MATELLVLENLTPAVVFAEKGGDPIVDAIKKEVLAVDRDISTIEGRKQVASLAHKVARSKTLLDEMGKTFAADLKKQTKVIDTERSRIWDALEALQKEVRQPLTEFEEKEKKRIADHEADIVEINAAGNYTELNWNNLDIQFMQNRLAEIVSDTVGWEEFENRAKLARDTAAKQIKSAIERRTKHDAEQAELERLRKAEAERIQKEREAKIQLEAAETARKQAEEKAAAEAKAVAEKAEAERRKIEQEKKAAEEREQDAIKAKKAAEDKAIADAKAAEEKAVRDRELAVQAERDRIEGEKRAEAEAMAKREANTKHRSKINNEALQGLVDAAGLTPEAAKAVVEAVVRGHVPHVSISY